MTWLPDRSTRLGFTGPMPNLEPMAQPAPGFTETASAVFQMDNDVTNFIDLMTRPTFERTRGYKPLERLKKEAIPESDYDYFYDTQSDAEFDFRKTQLAKERHNRAVVAASGTVPWLVNELAAGMASPLSAVPFLAGAKALRPAVKLGLSALATGVSTTAQEALLRQAQVTRTWEESASAIASSIFIDAMIGAGAHLYSRVKKDSAAYFAANPREVPAFSREAGGSGTPTLRPTAGNFMLRKVEGDAPGIYDATGTRPGRQIEVEARPDNMAHITPESLPLIREMMGEAGPAATHAEIKDWLRARGHDFVVTEGFVERATARDIAREVAENYAEQDRVPVLELDPRDRELLEAVLGRKLADDEEVTPDAILGVRLQDPAGREAFPDEVVAFDPEKVTEGGEVTGETMDPVRFGEGVEDATDVGDDIDPEAIKAAAAGAQVTAQRAGGLIVQGRLAALDKAANYVRSWTGPHGRLTSQQVFAVPHDIGSQLVSSGEVRQGNVVGTPSAEGGTVAGRIAGWTGLFNMTRNRAVEIFKKAMLNGGWAGSEKEFREAQGLDRLMRMFGKGEHENQYVRESAETWDKEWVTPLGDDAIKVKLFNAGKRIDSHMRLALDPTKVNKSDFIPRAARNYERMLYSEYAKAREALVEKGARTAEDVGNIRKPLPEAREALDKVNADLEKLDEMRPLEVVEAEEQAADYRQRARDLGKQITQLNEEKKPFYESRVREASAAKKQLEAEARRLEGIPEVSKTREERARLRREKENLTKSAALMDERRQKKLDKVERSDQLQINTAHRLVKSGHKLLSRLPNLDEAAMRKEVRKWRNRFAKAAKQYDKNEDTILKEVSEEPDFERLMALDDEAVRKRGELTELAERLHQAEGLPREEMIQAINDAVDGLARKAVGINKRRTLRAQRLLEQAGQLDPKLAEARAAMKERDFRAEELAFEEKWAGDIGAERDFDKPNFTAKATELAMALRERVLTHSNRLSGMEQLEKLALSGARGSALDRTLLSQWDFEDLKDFVILDIEELAEYQRRTMAPDIEIARWSGDGDPGGKAKIDAMRFEYRDKVERVLADPKLEKKAKDKRLAQMDRIHEQNLKDAMGMIAFHRNKLGVSHDPRAIVNQIGEVLMHLASVTKLGGVLASSITDIGKTIGRYGILNVFRDAFLPFMRMTREERRMFRRELQLAGVVIDVVRGSNLVTQFREHLQMMSDKGRTLEGPTSFLASKMGRIALFEQWTNIMKQMSSMAAVTRMMDSIALVKGEVKGSQKELIRARTFLAQRNITGEHMDRIWMQTRKTGNKVKGVNFPNTDKWDVSDPNVKDSLAVFRAALSDEARDTIVTAGAERPLMMGAASSPWARMIFHFKNFAVASTSKTLLAGLQARDAAALTGFISMLGIGLLQEYVKSWMMGGQQWERWKSQGAGAHAMRAISASGVFGMMQWPIEGFTYLAGGRNRYDPRSAFMPPGLDYLWDAFETAGDVRRGPTQATANKAFSLIPYNQLFYFQWMLQKASDGKGVGGFTSLPKRRKPQRQAAAMGAYR